jgi:hypothetical protein
MNRLSSVIGPAPSERTFEDFCLFLSKERNRMRESLAEFRSRKSGASKVTKAPSQASRSLTALVKSYGLSPEDLAKGLALIESQKQKQLPQKGTITT